MVRRIHQVPDLQLAQQVHAPDAFVMLALTQQHPNSQHLVKKPGQSLAALVLTKDHMFVGTSIGPAIQVERSAFAYALRWSLYQFFVNTWLSLQLDASCCLSDNAVWLQDPLLAPMVAGNMAIAADVQTGSIICDLQKVLEISIIAQGHSSGIACLAANQDLNKGIDAGRGCAEAIFARWSPSNSLCSPSNRCSP